MTKLFTILLLVLTPFFITAQNQLLQTAKDWKEYADKEYEIFDKENEKEIYQAFYDQKPDYNKYYSSLMNALEAYINADKLAQLVEENGMGENTFIKPISSRLESMHSLLINAGIYYNDMQEYAKASMFFEYYFRFPQLRIYNDKRSSLSSYLTKGDDDLPYLTIQYYSIICAIQAKDSERTILLLEELISTPYIKNEMFKESDLYELLANEYSIAGNTDLYVESLKIGNRKFPDNSYFSTNLINEYIRSGDAELAIKALDEFAKKDKANADMYIAVKASIYVDQKEYKKAEKEYKKTLKKNKKSIRALEGIGVLYVIEAQNLKENIYLISNKKEVAKINKKVIKLYKKSLPYFEKHYKLAEKGEDEDEMRKSLTKLQNVYFNMNLLGVNKTKELENVEKKLESMKP